jgi:hypothetical protein
LRSLFERFFQVVTQKSEFLLTHQFLHALKQLAFFLADVRRQALREFR